MLLQLVETGKKVLQIKHWISNIYFARKMSLLLDELISQYHKKTKNGGFLMISGEIEIN